MKFLESQAMKSAVLEVVLAAFVFSTFRRSIVSGRYVIDLTDVADLDEVNATSEQLRNIIFKLANRTGLENDAESETGGDLTKKPQGAQNKVAHTATNDLKSQIFGYLTKAANVGSASKQGDTSESIISMGKYWGSDKRKDISDGAAEWKSKKSSKNEPRRKTGNLAKAQAELESLAGTQSRCVNGGGSKKSCVIKIFKQMAQKFNELLEILKCDEPSGSKNVTNTMTLETVCNSKGDFIRVKLSRKQTNERTISTKTRNQYTKLVPDVR